MKGDIDTWDARIGLDNGWVAVRRSAYLDVDLLLVVFGDDDYWSETQACLVKQEVEDIIKALRRSVEDPCPDWWEDGDGIHEYGGTKSRAGSVWVRVCDTTSRHADLCMAIACDGNMSRTCVSLSEDEIRELADILEGMI